MTALISAPETLAKLIEPQLPSDAIALTRALNLRAMLEFIDKNIRPALGEEVLLSQACERVFASEEAAKAILAAYPFLSPYVDEYFRKN